MLEWILMSGLNKVFRNSLLVYIGSSVVVRNSTLALILNVSMGSYVHSPQMLTLTLVVANLVNTKCRKENWKIIETFAIGFSSESTQRELFNEYQHDMVLTVIKNLCIPVLFTKVDFALEGLSAWFLMWFCCCVLQVMIKKARKLCRMWRMRMWHKAAAATMAAAATSEASVIWLLIYPWGGGAADSSSSSSSSRSLTGTTNTIVM